MNIYRIIKDEDLEPFYFPDGKPTGEYGIETTVSADELDDNMVVNHVKLTPMLLEQILEDLDFQDVLKAIKQHIEPGGAWEYEKLPMLLSLIGH